MPLRASSMSCEQVSAAPAGQRRSQTPTYPVAEASPLEDRDGRDVSGAKSLCLPRQHEDDTEQQEPGAAAQPSRRHGAKVPAVAALRAAINSC